MKLYKHPVIQLYFYKNKKSAKGIYGKATEEDIKELKEEGIETELMPWLKNTSN